MYTNSGFSNFCKSTGKNQLQIAKMLKISQSSLSGYCNDVRIPHTIIIAMADTFNVTCDEVLGRKPPTPSFVPTPQTYSISTEHKACIEELKGFRRLYDELVAKHKTLQTEYDGSRKVINELRSTTIDPKHMSQLESDLADTRYKLRAITAILGS